MDKARSLAIDFLSSYRLILRTCDNRWSEDMTEKEEDNVLQLKVYTMQAITRLNHFLLGEKKEPVMVKCKGCGQPVEEHISLNGMCFECINDNFDEWVKTGKKEH